MPFSGVMGVIRVVIRSLVLGVFRAEMSKERYKESSHRS
jgi:hypothetical protein